MRPQTTSTSDASGGAKNSASIVLDYWGLPQVSLQVVVTGTVTYSIQQTLDNVLDSSVTPTWFDHPDSTVVGATASKQANYGYVPYAVRLRQTAGSGSAILTVIQAGGLRS